MRLKLSRFVRSTHGVFGVLENLFIHQPMYTVEEEDLDNQRNISCIPAGVYTCRRTTYHRHGYETFEICDVPNRTRILFHIANTEEDVMGCVGLGTHMAVIKRRDEDTGERVRKLAVGSSRAAFKLFMQKLEGIDEFELEIVDPKV